MKYDDRISVETKLQTVPEHQLRIVRRTEANAEVPVFQPFCTELQGKGQVEIYRVFPGVDAFYLSFLASEIALRQPPFPSIVELFHCRTGRVGWSLQANASFYLGTGDLSVHSAACCTCSSMMLPLGYAQGLLLSIDLQQLVSHCPNVLQQAGLDLKKMQKTFCNAQPLAFASCTDLDRIFSPLYTVDPTLRLPYLQLKVQELLLYLSHTPKTEKTPTQYFSQQTELIQDIHTLLTEHLDMRFTIEDLSKRYAINTSTLKSIFKTVYGAPIATYMKEYRMHQAMKLLCETDLTIAQIAEKVGYESQGKFANAFKDIAQVLPKEYRKAHATGSTSQ